MPNSIMKIYTKLYDLYGPQGWWPLINLNSINPNKTRAVRGYHPNNYDLPEKLMLLSDETLKSAICCAGFLNQKSIYIREITRFFIKLNGNVPKRKNFLGLKGLEMKQQIRFCFMLIKSQNLLLMPTQKGYFLIWAS